MMLQQEAKPAIALQYIMQTSDVRTYSISFDCKMSLECLGLGLSGRKNQLQVVSMDCGLDDMIEI